MIDSLFSTRQAPRVAHGGLRGDNFLGVSDPDAITERQLRESYRGHVYAFLNLRANAIANGIDQLLVQRQLGREQFESVDIDHPWQELLNRPSSNYNAWHIYRYIALARDAYQGAYFEIGRDNRGVPEELFPIFPEFGEVRPIGSTDGGIREYRFQPRGAAEPRMIPNENLIWLRHEDPVSPLEAAPLIRAADYQSDIDLFMHVYRRTSVKEGNRPDVYLSSESRLTSNQQRRYSEEFAEKYMKPGNRDNIPVFGAGMEMKRVGIPPEELEYVDGAELNIKELLDIFGIPRAMVISESSNRSTSIAARRDFWQNTIIPNVTAIARQLTHELQQAFDASTRLVVSVPEGLAPLDPELERKIKNERVTHGFDTLNEMREEDGKDPYDVPFADEPLMPSNVAPLSRLGMAQGGSGEVPEVEPEPDGEDEDRSVRGDGRAGDPPNPLQADRLTLQWRAIDAEKRGLIGAATAQFRELFRQTQEQVMEEMEGLRSIRQEGTEATFSIDMIFNLQAFRDGLRAAVQQVMNFVVPAGAEMGAEQLAVDDAINLANAVVEDDDVIQTLKHLERQSVRQTSEAVRQQLAEQVQIGLRDGETVEEIMERVQDQFDDLTRNRARLVARTNVTAGFERGQLGAFQRGGAQRKRWLSQRDGRVRGTHQDADGQQKRLDDFFEVGGHQLKFPGDPSAPVDEVANCRCTMLPVLANSD